MAPELIFYIGLVTCGVAVAITTIAIVVFYFSKKSLNKRLDAEYGKRRR